MDLREFTRPSSAPKIRADVEAKNSAPRVGVEASSREEFQELVIAARRYGLDWADNQHVEVITHEDS